MKTLKKYLIYIIIIAVFWLFSNILIYLAINGTYAHIDTRVYTNSPEITVGQSAATYINGVVKGYIRNNTNATMDRQYLKIDLYSTRHVKLGTKYVEIKALQAGETQNFEMWYKFTDVKYANLSIIDNIQGSVEEEFLSEETAPYLIIGTLLVLYFI